MSDQARLVFKTSPGVLSVSGKVDASNSDHLLDRTSEEARQSPFTLDMSGVGFLDSAGLRALLTAASRLVAEGWGPLRVRPSPAVARLFEIARVDTAPGIELDPSDAFWNPQAKPTRRACSDERGESLAWSRGRPGMLRTMPQHWDERLAGRALWSWRA
jgi:anti-anti-sigma factor